MAKTSDDKEQPDKPDQRRNQNLLVFISGGVLLLIVLAAMLFKKDVNTNTFWVVRLIATLGAAGFGALIPGYLQIQGAGWKAGGAVAFGALAYFFNPPPLTNDIPKNITVQGIVYVNGKAQSNVDVKANEVEQQKITNMFGKFIFTIQEDHLPPVLTFDVKYKQTDSMLRDVDTTIKLSKTEFSKPDFEIKVRSNLLPVPKRLLQGHVWREETTEGIKGVIVSAEGFTAETDDGGFFSFYVETHKNLIPINFRKEGYISKTYSFPPNKDVSVFLRKQ